MFYSNFHKFLTAAGVCLVIAYATAVGLTASPMLDVAPASAQTGGHVPGNVSGNFSDAAGFWGEIRKGVTGKVNIPDKKAGTLFQPQGDAMMAFRNKAMSSFGGWILLASIIALAAFFLIRGRIKISAGPAGQTIERFNALERATHWLTASSFVILALTGLNVLYGKFFLPAMIGKSAFATLTQFGKLAHNYIGFAFIVGLVLMFVLWVKDNLPGRYDLGWIAMGGGMFSDEVHVDSERFNFGQKAVFWLVIIGGGSLAFSGICLLFPFEFAPFAPTFEIMQSMGFKVSADISPLYETQLALAWHGVLGLLMIAAIIFHIYIGSLGMEGAIDAVASGQVDLNWAREHHNKWVERVEAEGAGEADQQPAE